MTVDVGNSNLETNVDTSVNNVEVTEPQTTADTQTDIQSAGTDTTTDQQGEKGAETAEPHKQSAEVNAHFADLRRKQAYDELKQKYSEKETAFTQLESKNKRLENRVSSILGNFVEGDSLEDMLISLEAQAKGVTVDEIRQSIQIEEQRQQQQQQFNDELNYYKGIAHQYQIEQAERLMAEDLAEIQKFDPSITSLDDLGDEFVNLRFTVNPLTGKYYSIGELYNHFKAKIKPLPRTSPAVNVSNTQKEEPNKYEKMSSADFQKELERIKYGR